MLSNKTVAVIGAGRIGSAIIQALRDCYGGSVRIIATGRRDETVERARSLGAEATRDNREG